MIGGEVCLPGLACANGVADGKKIFSEQGFPWPPPKVSSLGVVGPNTDVPHGANGAGFSQTFGASA